MGVKSIERWFSHMDNKQKNVGMNVHELQRQVILGSLQFIGTNAAYLMSQDFKEVLTISVVWTRIALVLDML